jgi:uncharacterized membrane protein YhaH (DUF805 family)
MRRFLIPLALLGMAVGPAAPIPSAWAQPWLGLQNSMIEIAYVPPVTARNRATYELLKRRQVLEELSAFLAPLRLPRTLRIEMLECHVINAFYSPDKGVQICYEFPAYVAHVASRMRIRRGFTKDDVIVGTFVQVVLHEIGHAVFDMLQVPVLGREEDGADQIAAFVMLNFGTAIARRTLTGSAQFLRATDEPMWGSAFADEHGSPLQRFYNLLCIAYGGQPGTFKDVVEAGTLPRERADGCDREYDQVALAFAETILPHVDQGLLKKGQSIAWAEWKGEYPGIDDLIADFRMAVILTLMAAVLLRGISASPKNLVGLLRTALKFGNVRGRLGLRCWWAYMMTMTAVVSLVVALDNFLSRFELAFMFQVLLAAIAYAIYGASYWYSVLCVRRLHDRNLSGWWVAVLLAPCISYWIGSAAERFHPGSLDAMVKIVAVALIPSLWLVIEMGFRRGTRGDNRYGPEHGSRRRAANA